MGTVTIGKENLRPNNLQRFITYKLCTTWASFSRIKHKINAKVTCSVEIRAENWFLDSRSVILRPPSLFSFGYRYPYFGVSFHFQFIRPFQQNKDTSTE